MFDESEEDGMDADTVVDSYVHDVARRLPPARRNDVAFELRSLLTDELGERAAAEGRPADEAMAVDLLRDFGRPADTAAGYHRPATILAPGDTWSFVVAAIAGGAVISLLASPGPGTAGDSAARVAATQQGGEATLAWLGILVVLFGAKNLVLRHRPDAFAWRPRPVRDRDVAGRLGNAAIAAGLAAFLVLYLAPGPVLAAVTGGRVDAADLAYTDSFTDPLRMGWLVVLLVAAIALELVVVVRGRWWRGLRLARIALTFLIATQLGWHARYGSVFQNPDVDSVALWVAASAAAVLMVLAGIESYREYTRVDPAPAVAGAPNRA
jgi:hypothetical protein